MWPNWRKKRVDQSMGWNYEYSVVTIWSNGRGPMTFDPFPKVIIILNLCYLFEWNLIAINFVSSHALDTAVSSHVPVIFLDSSSSPTTEIKNRKQAY